MGDPQIKNWPAPSRITRDIESPRRRRRRLERNVSREQRFEGHVELYRIADLSKSGFLPICWATMPTSSGPAPRASHVRELSRTITATVSSAPPLFDPVRARSSCASKRQPRLPASSDMFVDVEFNSSAPAGVSVPAEAVLDSGMHKIVYVETSDNVFEPRTVEVGAAFGNRVTVKKGLQEGDRVVTAGNFMIDSKAACAPQP